MENFSVLRELKCISLPKMLQNTVRDTSSVAKYGELIMFPRLPFPIAMDREHALECLFDFGLLVAAALHELHSAGFAHLDVQLENINFVLNK